MLNYFIILHSIFTFKPMDPPSHSERERDSQIASILVLIISITEKVEKLKEKLSGFSHSQFSPEQVYRVLDLSGKGYVDEKDICWFVNNDRVESEWIEVLIGKMNGEDGSERHRLTYLGYLHLITPFFNGELAKDLLIRDTLAHSGSSKELGHEKLQPSQQPILMLLHELLLLHCICIGEHIQAATLLNQDHMVTPSELAQIFAITDCPSHHILKNIFHFITHHSDLQIQKSQMPFLLAFLSVSEIQIRQYSCLSKLILRPTLNHKTEVSVMNQPLKSHAVVNKSNLHFLSRKDLGCQNINFLEYIHPSVKKDQSNRNQMNKKESQRTLIKIASEETKAEKKIFEREIKNIEKRVNNAFSEELASSQTYMQGERWTRLETPILEQFMKKSLVGSNTKKDYADQQLSSSSNQSDAFVSVNYQQIDKWVNVKESIVGKVEGNRWNGNGEENEKRENMWFVDKFMRKMDG